MHDSDVTLRRRFLAAFIKRVVVYDADGVIELTDAPALGALNAAKDENAPHSMVRGVRTSLWMVPPTGFEPVIFTLKG